MDTAHNYLHEQKFWITPEPRDLEKEYLGDYNAAYEKKREEVLEKFRDWVKLFKLKRG